MAKYNNKSNIIKSITLKETNNKVLEALGIATYLDLNRSVDKVNVANDFNFQRKFNGFYKLRQRPEDWYKHYYNVFEMIKNKIKSDKGKITIDVVLKEIYERTKTIELSFSSKMLHTLSPSKYPIYDSRVKKALGLNNLFGKTWKEKIKDANDIYKDLIDKYKDKEFDSVVEIFDKVLPNTGLSRIKKIDTILYWYGR